MPNNCPLVVFGSKLSSWMPLCIHTACLPSALYLLLVCAWRSLAPHCLHIESQACIPLQSLSSKSHQLHCPRMSQAHIGQARCYIGFNAALQLSAVQALRLAALLCRGDQVSDGLRGVLRAHPHPAGVPPLRDPAQLAPRQLWAGHRRRRHRLQVRLLCLHARAASAPLWPQSIEDWESASQAGEGPTELLRLRLRILLLWHVRAQHHCPAVPAMPSGVAVHCDTRTELNAMCRHYCANVIDTWNQVCPFSLWFHLH